VNYWGQQETPVWNPDLFSWGFSLFGTWIPLITIG
jgi:hypothetical protein